MAVQKKFQIKIYDKDDVFIKTLSPNIVVNEIGFRAEINGGYGECRITLDLPFDDFDEGVSIDFENIVRIYEIDDLNPTPRLIYTGIMSEYIPTANGSIGQVQLRLVGLVTLLSRGLYDTGVPFATPSHTNEDPADILKDIIDNHNSYYSAGLISYSGGNIDNVGSLVSIQFPKKTWLQSVTDTFNLAGSGWFWKIEADGQVYLKEKPISATHSFQFQKHVQAATVKKTGERIINSVRVVYDGGSIDDSDATSITNYNLRRKIVEKNDIKNAAGATNYAAQLIDDNKDPKNSAQLVINSSYDLESIKVGDTCKVLGIKKDSTLFGDNMLIVALSYDVDTVTIELEEITDDFGAELDRFIQS